MRLSIGYPDADDERGVLLQSVGVGDPLERMRPVLDAGRVLALQERVERVHADASLVDYLMAVVQATRAEPRLRAGASTRAAIGLFRAARAYALVDGRDFLAPDDVRRLVVPCLAHRLLPAGASSSTGEAYDEAVAVLEDVVAAIPLPV
jgi:MoxR-like ATPase